MKVNEIKVGAILSYIIIGLNILVGLIYTPLLVRMLGQSEYGLYSMVASIVAYLTILDFGFGNAIIIYTARYRQNNQKEDEQRLHGMFLIIYIIIGILSVLIGMLLYFYAENMFGKSMEISEIETVKKLILILIFNIGITFPFSIFSSILTAYEKFVFIKIINIINILLKPLIMIPLLYLGYRSIALAVVLTIINVLTLLLNLIYCIKKINIKLKFGNINFILLKEIFVYSIFIFLNTIIDKVSWNIDQFILGIVSGTVSVAVYSVAAQLNSMYLTFSTAISGVLLPKIARMERNKASDKDFGEIFIKTGRIQFVIMALILTGFIIFGREFIYIWVGKRYLKSYLIACILIVPVSIPLIQNIGISILQAKNKHKFRAIVLFVIAIINILISIPLAKLYQGIGSAIGTSLALILGQGIILNIYYKKKIKLDITEFWKQILKMALPIFVMALIFYLLNSYYITTNFVYLLIKISIYILAYFVIVWKFSINKYEKDLLIKPIKDKLSRRRKYVKS